jgi:proteic killer suppression protein
VIQSFKSKDAEALFRGSKVAKNLRPIAKLARRKLDMIDYAEQLGDLRVPPGNRLEALKGDRRGQHSIRINDQWRICFVWRSDGPHDVEIVDYH